ncbi:LysM peptidoglycan-binding domain-containing protein [Limosilactobacillus reuteri]|uniref:LysM peptidoglycan-binding domain-containing protein n=1 Tax=Limosilactobacillus reuteri TaxID=1598 RepID=UPI00386E8B57
MKHRLSKKVAVAMAAAFLVAPITTGMVELNSQQLTIVKAAKGDRGTDQSRYQGPQGRTAYGDEKFQINQMGGTVDGYNMYDQSTYASQTVSTIARGMRAHNYIWWQNVTTTWQADQVLNYFLPKVQTPKGSIVALDVESGNQNTQAIQHACDRIKQAGYTPMYANIGIFQFTSMYVSGGLDGDVDLTGITDNGYKNGNPQRPKTNTPAVDTGKQLHQNTHTYTVKSGDSWWKIATDHHMNMYALAKLNGATIQTTIYPGQVLRVADNGQTANVNNKVQQPITQPSQSTWHDRLGDTWHSEKGTFVANTWLHLRWGARPSSSSIAIIGPGTVIKYDAYSRHGGYVWLRQPREHGQYGYIACRDANTNEAYGTFK